MPNRYFLLNKDVPLLEFECDRDVFRSPVFSVSQKFSDKLPIGFDFSTGDGIEKWLESRRAPANRQHIEKLLIKYGCDDLEAYINVCHTGSLNDTFWVKPTENTISWDSISFYRNKFNNAIANLAFDGAPVPHAGSTVSPEFSTDGSFSKCWKRFDDGLVCLLKKGRTLDGSIPLEPFMEVCAYEIGKNLCQNIVQYEIIDYHNEFVTRCPLFTSEKIAYSPIAYIHDAGQNIKSFLSYFDSLGDGERFREMMVLDALILNSDRHSKNFGILYDADSLDILGMAPVFDNNFAFIPYVNQPDVFQNPAHIPTAKNPYGNFLNDVAIHSLTPAIENNLKNLKNFEFSKELKQAFADCGIEAKIPVLQQILDKQIDTVLGRHLTPLPVSRNLVLEDITIQFSSHCLPRHIQSDILNQEVRVEDFDILFQSGERVPVSNISASLSFKDNVFTLDIYDADFYDAPQDSEITGISPILIVASKNYTPLQIKPSRFDMQFSFGPEDIYFSPQKPCIVMAPSKELAQKKAFSLEHKELTL